jgi:glutamate racemase
MTYPYPTAPIGIFDSGFGGLSVMKALIDLLPNEDIIYFGDCARVPYGNKSQRTICQYSIENSAFLISQGVKVVVIACNTASAYASQVLSLHFPQTLFVDVIEPTVAAIAHNPNLRSIQVMATRATISSNIYQHRIGALRPDIQTTQVAAPLLVPLIEEMCIHRHYTGHILDEYLHTLHHAKIDLLLLACTHYPLIRDLVASRIPAHTAIMDCASSTADWLKKLLSRKGLLNPKTTPPHYLFYTSDDPKTFSNCGQMFLKHPISQVEHVILPSTDLITSPMRMNQPLDSLLDQAQ